LLAAYYCNENEEPQLQLAGNKGAFNKISDKDLVEKLSLAQGKFKGYF